MTTDEPIHTALTARHQERGATLTSFAGWLMPIEFTGTLAEHQAVRDHAGVFDVSHLGTVWITGAGAGEAVAATLTNDPSSLADGQSQYTLCCDDHGGIVDDLIVYRLAANRFLTVPNAANTGAVVTALRRAADTYGATVADASRDWAILAVQGPDSLPIVAAAHARATGQDLDPTAIPHLGIAPVEAWGETGYVCRTGYTGEIGCELVLPNGWVGDVWDALVDADAEPAGLGARDTLRLEMGYPLHGNDLTRETDPFEARLSWAVKLDRGPFRGQEALRSRKEQGPSRRLWGLRGDSRRPVRAGMEVAVDGRPVGAVTSGGFSPSLSVGIGLAYLDDPLGPGDEVTVDVRGRDTAFTVVKPPFVERDPKA